VQADLPIFSIDAIFKAEFGLPNFRSLSLADKSHLWFASLDMLALLFFVWQVATEYATGSSGLAIASDPASTIRIWLALTMRQSCLLVVAAVTLVHVRLGQSATVCPVYRFMPT
jgi:hypothetical protein